jgi:hypothetical protein
VLHVFGALAEVERALMHERTMAAVALRRSAPRNGHTPPNWWLPVSRSATSPKWLAPDAPRCTGRFAVSGTADSADHRPFRLRPPGADTR